MNNNEDVRALAEEIAQLKKERDAVILAHYYARPEVQAVADILGDSLALSQLAATTEAKVIVFCGVHFMAETAAIISPEKKVLIPVENAGCSLAESVTAAGLATWRKYHPNGLIVSYVNTSAAVKAETDYCVTSANALKVIETLPLDVPILFGPDKNLGEYINLKTGRNMDLWQGDCYVHRHITGELIREYEFIPITREHYCEYMKLTTLTDLRDALRDEKHVVTIAPKVRERALLPIQRMLAVK